MLVFQKISFVAKGYFIRTFLDLSWIESMDPTLWFKNFPQKSEISLGQYRSRFWNLLWLKYICINLTKKDVRAGSFQNPVYWQLFFLKYNPKVIKKYFHEKYFFCSGLSFKSLNALTNPTLVEGIFYSVSFQFLCWFSLSLPYKYLSHVFGFEFCDVFFNQQDPNLSLFFAILPIKKWQVFIFLSYF